MPVVALNDVSCDLQRAYDLFEGRLTGAYTATHEAFVIACRRLQFESRDSTNPDRRFEFALVQSLSQGPTTPAPGWWNWQTRQT